MNFTRHLALEGKHAVFSPSQYSWLNYSDDKALEVWQNKRASERGTRLHAWAKDTIDLGIRQPRSKQTLYSFVNDAIGFRMATEVLLCYSERFFGTADAISFRKNLLRIHDLKTGKIPAHMEQLEIYAALFCLEYRYKPYDIQIELRIYQNDEIVISNPDPADIDEIMKKIVHFDDLVKANEEE